MTDSDGVRDTVAEVHRRVAAFEAEAHQILARHESSVRSRVISLDTTRHTLQGLSLRQDELLQEALLCIEHELFRAGMVSAWLAFIDFLEGKLASDGLVKLRAARPKWDQQATIQELRENHGEHQMIETARVVKLMSNSLMKNLHNKLSVRNECAHPSAYKPSLNISLGYVSELIDIMADLQQKN